jgi:hypothetical protein
MYLRVCCMYVCMYVRTYVCMGAYAHMHRYATVSQSVCTYPASSIDVNAVVLEEQLHGGSLSPLGGIVQRGPAQLREDRIKMTKAERYFT